MTTHVFVVDGTTLKLHLEYLFAGTGAKDNAIDFNNAPSTSLYHTTENMLIGMIADASRIRSGDQVIFYLQQDFSKNIYDGKFYGIFETINDWSFLDNNDSNQFLQRELGKSLTFRTMLRPHRIYPAGVTEWEALDEISNLTSPNQMLWSLIYRKLKGNRGNTMITIYEAERLGQLIRNKNNRSELSCDNEVLSFDLTTQEITCLDSPRKNYTGRKEDINVLPRLMNKFQAGKAFESHLQAYITKNLGKATNSSLDSALIGAAEIEWLGNEVSCGVGMQRIDILPSIVQNGQKVIVPVELKAVEAEEKNLIQIQRYVDWVEQYYIPNRQSDIQPALVSKKTQNRTSSNYQKLIQSIKKFNEFNSGRCFPLKFIEFDIINDELFFKEISY